jgi:DNA-binding transcriptional MocR family regulator
MLAPTLARVFPRSVARSERVCYPLVIACIERAVNDGRLKGGDRLPTHRELAAHLGVAVATITRTYAEAQRRGLIVGEVGRGTFVTEHYPDASTHRSGGTVDMTINRPPNEGAACHFASALRSLSKRRDVSDLLGIEPANGWFRHRAMAARWIGTRGLVVQPDQVIACNGVQHALSVILTALVQPGAVVATEELNYPGIRLLADLHRLRLVGLPVDGDGLDTDALESLCRKQRVDLVITSPTAHNPTTVTMSLERRKALVRLAERYDFVIVENDVLGMMPVRPATAIAALAPDRACYVTGLTKIIAAGLRLAFIAATQPFIRQLTNAVHGTTWMPPPLMLELFTLWADDGTIDEVIAWHRRELAARTALTRRILAGIPYSSDANAYHLWINLPRRVRLDDVMGATKARGVLISPGPSFAVDETTAAKAGVRVSMGGQNDRERLQRGLRIFRDVWWESA